MRILILAFLACTVGCNAPKSTSCQMIVNDDLCVLEAASIRLTSQRMDILRIIDIELLWSDETARYVAAPEPHQTGTCSFSEGKFTIQLEHGILTTEPQDLSSEGLSYGYSGLVRTNGRELFANCELPPGD